MERWLAVCIAVLLTIAPLAQPSSVLDFVVLASAESVSAFDEDASGDQPARALRPAPPSTLAILSRQPLLGSALELPPVKPALLRPSAPQAPLAAFRVATASRDDIGQNLHRDSVGTARTPTGPPS